MSEPFFTGVAMFDDEPKIPPPSEADLALDLAWIHRHAETGMISAVGEYDPPELKMVVRRCHAAERDRDAYRELLAEAAEALGELGPHSPLELFRRAREVHARITAELEAAK